MVKRKINFNIIIPIILLSIISIISIKSALLYTSPALGNLALKQAIWYGLGWILVIILYHYKNEYLYRNAWFLYIVGNIMLVLLLFFGTSINNSRCWFTIPGVGSFQPSEFMKLFLMLALATMIHNFRSDYEEPTCKQEFVFLIKSLVILMIPSILTFLQPDTGAVLIYCVIYIVMIFSAGIRFRWFALAFFIILLLMSGFLYLYFMKENVFMKVFGTSLYYRLERVFNWSTGSGLQLENSMASIGSAGLFGHGFNHTPIYFPESSTDFIFAVYASNFGLVGVAILICIIIYFDSQILILSKKKIEDINKYILAGIIGMLCFQQIQNISMTVGLLPITGITLPFVSYGGSSLLSYMLIIGLLLNISEKKERIYKYR